MKLQRISLFAVLAVALLLQNASAQLLESWEGTLNGWTVQDGNYTYAPSTTFGVTDGTDSAALTGTAGPGYGQMLLSPYQASWTALLGNAASLSLDIYTPPESFGYYLQFDVDVNNADIGYQSLTGYSYPGTTIGSQYTLTIPISPSIAAGLAASPNPTQIAIQIGGGYSGGNETMYLDNLRVTAIPEPSTFGLLGLGVLSLFFAVRRRVR